MFKLINLSYSDLSPAISAETLSFHHGKHLRGYVDNLNKLIAGTEFETMPIEEIILKSSPSLPTGNFQAIFNNAGQLLNHNLYFEQFQPLRETPDQAGSDEPAGTSSSLPAGNLFRQIEKQWGTIEAFRTEFEAKGVGLFGSGWVWLAAHTDGALEILQCPGADNPVAHGLKPVFTFDVWEHAYYLDWQNRRADHLKALWQVIDWSVVEARYGS